MGPNKISGQSPQEWRKETKQREKQWKADNAKRKKEWREEKKRRKKEWREEKKRRKKEWRAEKKRRKRQRRFLLKQLIRRDFQARYKRTFLGVVWSMLSPLIQFATQAVIFSYFFRRGEHFISYLIVGNIVYHYFSDATNQSMFAFTSNIGILSRIRIDKKLFMISKNIACLINLFLTMLIMFAIVLIDGIQPDVIWMCLCYPILCLFFFNMGIGYILSTLHVFFRDTQYFYGLIVRNLMYFSAIFYRVSAFPEDIQALFFFNPVYCYIYYFRSVVMDRAIPSLQVHLMCFLYAFVFFLLGKAVYALNHQRFFNYY